MFGKDMKEIWDWEGERGDTKETREKIYCERQGSEKRERQEILRKIEDIEKNRRYWELSDIFRMKWHIWNEVLRMKWRIEDEMTNWQPSPILVPVKLAMRYWRASASRTVVKHLFHHFKVMASSPATLVSLRERKMAKTSK